MVTVLNRFKFLGLPYDNNQLSELGTLVSHDFVSRNLHGRVVTTQTEFVNGEKIELKVWAYPDEWSENIDEVIKKYYTQKSRPKRKRIVHG